MKSTYRVGGMTCDGCANSVKRAIAVVEPTATVDVDLDAGTVSVDGATSPDSIGPAVEAAGFDFEADAQ